ncbi:hypothetical protein [Arcobacter peruensis]|uniref:hypothetical protein n=1 Tax=Arcobacter peruensis TaxID=2320140 RepID=UPI000F08BA30|nr:hypothetical protein [Arcobacter peruensis]
MDYKTKKKIPKRDENKYKEIEDFKDFELVNNAFYEMGIRTKRFKELEKKYVYCENLYTKIYKYINWDKPLENIESGDFSNDEDIIYTIVNKSAKENFEEALKKYAKDSLEIHNEEMFKLLELDFEQFKKEIQITSLENKENDKLIESYCWIEDLSFIIPKIIKKDLYIDFFEYYNEEEETDPKIGVEYEESSATSLYKKYEYKKTYYIETIIDDDNNKITRSLYPLTKRKLLTDHVLKFSSNHLILHKQVIKFLEDFFKVIEVKIKKQTALADAFFCYDYYKFRVEEVEQENKKREKENLENTILQEAKDSIEKIDRDTYSTYQQKAEERIPYKETIQYEELKPLKKPTIRKGPNHIFDESNFKKSNIKPGTAYNYYDWIKPYIDNNEYINIINSEQLF